MDKLSLLVGESTRQTCLASRRISAGVVLDLLCSVDEFWQGFGPHWQPHLLTAGQRQRLRRTALHPSEILTIVVIAFHQSHYRTFKAYATAHVLSHWRAAFPQLVSYQRFVALLPSILVPLTAYLHTQRGVCTGISVVDSTDLAVCHNARIGQHPVFAGRPNGGRLPSTGSSASSGTWWSMIAAS